jgi:hypothetical protein
VKRQLVRLGILWSFVVAMGLGAAGSTSADGITPVISEFLASNGSREPLGEGDLVDADGDSSDWIELHNPTAQPFDLGGWYLTDDAGKPARWRFPSPTLLAPEGYLVVFASDKDRTTGELHTNFKLAAEGSYLALVMPDGRTVAFDYGPSYPPQRRDVSYGLTEHGIGYFAVPTPGHPNPSTPIAVVADPGFSHAHGFYDAPFTLTLFCDTPDATIRYTMDGQPPTETSGQTYTAPIIVGTTTCVRAAAFKPGCLASEIRTRTFLFLADVVRQPSKPPGFPAVWGSALADYEMDPEILGELAPGQLAQALRSLPTMSIVMDANDLFGAAGIYVNWSRTGDDWERPCSVELMEPDGSDGFQVNCGIRIRGGAGRREPKKSFRLQFTSVYGPGQLRYPLLGPGAADRFDQLALRSGFNDAYAYVLGSERAQFIRDEFVRRLQLALGHPSPHGIFVHLYINGLYWGLYNPVERPESSFAATYFGGNKQDWDALASGRPVDGSTMTTWNAMLNLVRQSMMSNANYQRLQGNNPDGTRNPQYVNYLDLDNYIDYLLINFLVGNRDWPANTNWYAAMNRVEPTGWKSFSWDAEHSMGIDSNLTDNVTSISSSLGEPYARLRVNPEFCLRFADRVQRAFGPGGPFYVDPAHPLRDPGHPERNQPAALYAELADQVEPAIVSESARWGDNKGIAVCRIDDWRRERDWVLNTYLPQRPGVVLDQLRSAGLYPMIDSPAFQVNGVLRQGGVVPSNGLVTMTAGDGATIYYTTDGSDPRTPAYVSGDSKMVTLVPENAPKRVLVPSVANGGNLLANFSGGFEVTYYQANAIVDSLAAAEAVIANAALRTSAATQEVRVINYSNAGSPGHFDADRPWPGTAGRVDANDFVILATGKIMIPEVGNWTFGVRSNGGFSLTLSRRGKTYPSSYPGPRPPDDTLAVFNIAEAGLHDLRLVFYGHSGGAELEFFAAQGSFTAFSSADFRLVGDILASNLQAEDGTLWLTDSFADAAWRLGTGSVGFAQDGGGGPLVQTDVGAEMYHENGSCYIRIPFTLAGASYSSLTLRMRYNDGFIAYLNGTEVARRNFTGDPQWNSVANGAGPEEAARAQTTIDISDSSGLLTPGVNLLAAHGLNASVDSPDFLISVELVAGELSEGSVSPTALPYADPLFLNQGTRIKARAFNGKWSALCEAVFAPAVVAQSLRISEIMYHPPDTGNSNDPNTEFIELTNIANQSINLNLVGFTDGIDYIFPSFDLPAGGYCLVVRDLAAFQAKYGTKLPVAGQYRGGLDNGGEHIELVDGVGRVIESFAYDDSWFKSTDGAGYSLTVKDPRTTDPGSLSDKAAWQASTRKGGSPGTGD